MRSIVRTYPKGAIIVNEGEEGNAFFVSHKQILICKKIPSSW